MRRTSLATIATALAGLALVLAAPSAQAEPILGGGGCPDAESTQAFRQFGDPGNYVFLTNGGFERSGGWSLSGARRVEGNETFYVHSRSDRRSLSLPPGSSATSAPVCIEFERPTIRFFARNAGAATSTLRIDVLFTDPTGTPRTVRIGQVTAGPEWQPTPPVVVVANNLALNADGFLLVRFRVSPEGGAGDWQADDFYVDPYRKG